MNELATVSNVNLVKRTGALNNFDKKIKGARDAVNASGWKLAEVIANGWESEHVKECFNSQNDYAIYVGISQANFSKIIRAVNLRKYLIENEAEGASSMTLSTAQEYLPLVTISGEVDCDEIERLTKEGIKWDDTTANARQAVKSYREDTAGNSESDSPVSEDIESSPSATVPTPTEDNHDSDVRSGEFGYAGNIVNRDDNHEYIMVPVVNDNDSVSVDWDSLHMDAISYAFHHPEAVDQFLDWLRAGVIY